MKESSLIEKEKDGLFLRVSPLSHAIVVTAVISEKEMQ